MSTDARDGTGSGWSWPDADPALDAVVAHAAGLARQMDGSVRRIRVSSAASSVELELGRQPVEPAPVVPGPARVEEARTVVDDGVHQLLAPMVGTFYRAAEPGAGAFVSVGDTVRPGQQVGILEAMKLMNAVEAEHGGRVLEVLAGDGEAVEYGQPLMTLGVEAED